MVGRQRLGLVAFVGVAVATQTPTGRRSLVETLEAVLPDLEDFSGIWIEKDNAKLQLGEDGDVVLARGEDGGLVVAADGTTFFGSVSINGSLTTNGQDVSQTVQIGSINDIECSTPSLVFNTDDSTLYVCDGEDWRTAVPQQSKLYTCADANGVEGMYYIDPTGTEDYYSVFCSSDGEMRLLSSYDTYSTHYVTCGGVDDDDCLPDSGCTLLEGDGTPTTIPCDDDSLMHKKQMYQVDIEYVDENGKSFTDEALAALATNYTTSGSAAQIWVFDSTDNNLYGIGFEYAGSVPMQFEHTHFYTGADDEAWNVNSFHEPMMDIFGPQKIPTRMLATQKQNFGIAFVLAEKRILLTPVSAVLRSCVGAPLGRTLLDPSGQGDAFVGYCDGEGRLTIKPRYQSYVTYYETCGGTADSDCKPTCSDGCYLTKQNGDPTQYCCDSGEFSSATGSPSLPISYVDFHGFAIDISQLNALVDSGIDTTDSETQIWFYDATDNVNYPWRMTYYHSTPATLIMSDYKTGGEDSWDLSNIIEPDLNALVGGLGKIPSGISAGTKANVGVFLTFGQGQLRLTAAPKSCSHIHFAGIYDIDPTGTGDTFPVYCDGNGQTHIKSAFDAYSAYYSQCGGTKDSDCYPTCEDGCYLEDALGNSLGDCCDDGNVLEAQYQRAKFQWVDADGNDIAGYQLEALATITDSSLTNEQIFAYDSTDSATYDVTFGFYGGETTTVDMSLKTGVEDSWNINLDTELLTGTLGIHRIPKYIDAGSQVNIGVVVVYGDATLILTEASATRRSCVGVPATGTYLLDPGYTGHAFPAKCEVGGDMVVEVAAATFSVENAKCGGTDLSPCAPSCDDGCTIAETGECCNEVDVQSNGQVATIQYLDTRGHVIDSRHLQALASGGFDSSANSAQVWLFDATDYNGDPSYMLQATSYSGQRSNFTAYFDNSIDDEVWSHNSDETPELAAVLMGEGMIPMTVAAIRPITQSNFGAFVHFNNGEFRLSAPKYQPCHLVDTRVVQVNPTFTNRTLYVQCYDGKMKIRNFYHGLSVYYKTCGGSADTDCTPSCGDGCTLEELDGTATEICCNAGSDSSAKSSNSFRWMDLLGTTLTSDELDLLSVGVDSSWSNVQVWIFDATDQDNYELTTSYYGDVADDHEFTTAYYIGSDVNDWDLNTDMQFVADDLATILGMHKIPKALTVGTLQNWGLYFGFSEASLVISHASLTYETCFDVPYSGVWLIDPVGSGKAFPTKCHPDGTTFLTSKYSGYSTYYSKCGGTNDADCTPTCSDGCYLDGTSDCCDSSVHAHISQLTSVDMAWIDSIGNLIPTPQLDALANMAYNSSKLTVDDVWCFDALDSSGYELTVTSYGDADDSYFITPSGWSVDENAWDISSNFAPNDVDNSLLHGVFIGPNFIPKTMKVGTRENWGVWVHFVDNTLILSPM